jgi:hypothetical protein
MPVNILTEGTSYEVPRLRLHRNSVGSSHCGAGTEANGRVPVLLLYGEARLFRLDRASSNAFRMAARDRPARIHAGVERSTLLSGCNGYKTPK